MTGRKRRCLGQGERGDGRTGDGTEEDKDNSTKELGDFLFSVINAARLYHLNPDNALEHTNRKFISRFGYIEQKAKEQGKSLKDMTLGEMDALWNEAKSVLKDE